MTKIERVALTALPRELAAITGGNSPTYRKLWSLIVDGRVPAEQDNGRWFVRDADLPAIAAMLGMTARGVNSEPKPRKAAAGRTAA